MASIRSGIGEFQSTLPREERLFHNCFEHVFNYFNPRSHERSDTMPTPIKLSRSHISIHAPTRGATVNWSVILYISPISIHAPTRGATVFFASAFVSSVFQSTLPREERRELLHLDFQQRNFNPRSHERSDGILLKSTLLITYFNPRSHERSDKND